MKYLERLEALGPTLNVLRFSWWTDDGEREHDVVILSVGWLSLLLCAINGRPLVGIEVVYGLLRIWLGPLFWTSHPRTEPF